MNATVDDPVERRFVRTASGLVHVRTSGRAAERERLPLYMAHSGPGSSRGLVPLIAELGKTRPVVAPDMLGNGDSDPPAIADPDISFYVDSAVEVLDALGIARVDFYGDHSGAQIGCELALRHPHRVRRLILDGPALFSASDRALMLERYAPAVIPDDFGGHLMWAWNFVEGLFLHFPYFSRDPAHRLMAAPVPPAPIRQALVVDLLKALPTYHLAYRAMFAHALAERLPLLTQPTLLMAVHGDPLVAYLDEAAALLPTARKELVERSARASTVLHFLDEAS